MRGIVLFFICMSACMSASFISGTVSGLGAGKSLVLRSGTNTKIVTSNGPFQVIDNGPLAIAIQPAGQRCSIVANDIPCVFLSSTTVTWTRPTLNTDGTSLIDLTSFILYYGTDPTLTTYISRLIPASTLTTTVTNLVPGNTYYFSIASVSTSGGVGPRSNFASITK